MYCDLSPRLIGFHVVPASSVRNAPADEIATNIRLGSFGSSMIVCRHRPPAPGCQCGPVPWPRSPESSFQFFPPSVERNRAASSTPAYTVSASVSEGSRSEEHTSELQSRLHLVCRLLLEKKKKKHRKVHS